MDEQVVSALALQFKRDMNYMGTNWASWDPVYSADAIKAYAEAQQAFQNARLTYESVRQAAAYNDARKS